MIRLGHESAGAYDFAATVLHRRRRRRGQQAVRTHPETRVGDVAVLEIKVDLFRGQDSGLDLNR